jgi:hypothetical protein
MVGVLKDALVVTLTAAVKITSTVIKESATAVGTMVSSIAKAIPDVARALTSATVGILKAGATLAAGAAKIAGQLATTLVEIGGKMLVTATKVAKDVVTGLARIAFDAIGSALNTITGRGKAARTGKLTPVYVVGGYLAGTEGGTSSWAAAQSTMGGGRVMRVAAGAAVGAMTGTGALLGAGLGFFSPDIAERIAGGRLSIGRAMKRVKDRMAAPFRAASEAMKGGRGKLAAVSDGLKAGAAALREKAGELSGKVKGGFGAVRERTAQAMSALKESKWKASLLSASEKTREHLGGIRSGFSKFGSWMRTELLFLRETVPPVRHGRTV